MKIFALMHYAYEDYGGGGGSIVALYASREKAFSEVLRRLPARRRRKARIDDESWDLPASPTMSENLAIEEYDMVE